MNNLFRFITININDSITILYLILNKDMTFKNQLLNYYTYIFFVALLARVLFHIYSPIDYFPDSFSYLKLSNIIFTSTLIEDYQAMPGYPIFLYLSNKIFSNYFAFDILVSSILVLVASRLYFKIFNNEQGAKICALLFALYPFNILYASIMLSENSYVFFNFVGFACLYYNKNILGFLFIIIAILIRPSLDLFNIIIIILFSIFIFKDQFKTTCLKITIFILMYCAIFTPWWIYNYERFGQFVKLTPGLGIVLYSGNNKLNKTGGGNYPEDFNFDIVEGIDDPIKKDKIMKESAIKFIIENPEKFIKLCIKRFLRFYNIVPNYKKDNILSEDFKFSTVNLVSMISMVGLYFFSLLTLIKLNKKTFVKLLPLLTYTVLLTGIHVITIASIRYRFPIEFILLILSSFSINLIFDKIKHKF